MKDSRLTQFETFDAEELADPAWNSLPTPARPEPKPEPKEERIDPRVKRMTSEQFALYELLKHDPLKRTKMLLRPEETLAAYQAHLARKAKPAKDEP
jgi:hypothetical protein